MCLRRKLFCDLTYMSAGNIRRSIIVQILLRRLFYISGHVEIVSQRLTSIESFSQEKLANYEMKVETTCIIHELAFEEKIFLFK